MINRYPSLTSEIFLKKASKKNFLDLLKENSIHSYEFYDFGISALMKTIKLIGLKEGDNVLMPAYICRIVDELLRHFGIDTGFYRVFQDLSVNLKDLKNQINERTAAVLVVNYFGFPQASLPEIKTLCKKLKLFLIEDNAHSLLSMNNKTLLGTIGDIGFSSIWKSYPVKNGAILYINNTGILEGKNSTNLSNRVQEIKLDDFKYFISSLLTTFEYKTNFSLKDRLMIFRKYNNDTRNRKKIHFNFRHSRISKMTLNTIKKIDIETVIKKRRNNYFFWANYLFNMEGVKFLIKDMPDGVCPQVFPAIVDDSDQLMRRMIQKKIHVYNWPPLPDEIKGNNRYSFENYLSKHLIALPVHQNIDALKLQRIFR